MKNMLRGGKKSPLLNGTKEKGARTLSNRAAELHRIRCSLEVSEEKEPEIEAEHGATQQRCSVKTCRKVLSPQEAANYRGRCEDCWSTAIDPCHVRQNRGIQTLRNLKRE